MLRKYQKREAEKQISTGKCLVVLPTSDSVIGRDISAVDLGQMNKEVHLNGSNVSTRIVWIMDVQEKVALFRWQNQESN